MKLLGAHTFDDAACNGGQARSRRLGRLRVLAGFPQREIKKGRRPSARGSRAKIIKTRARFAAAASLSARSRRFISGYTSGTHPPRWLPTGRLHIRPSRPFLSVSLARFLRKHTAAATSSRGPSDPTLCISMSNYDAWNELETKDTRLGMEWTRDKTLELLREYQQRRVLWDWNARGYRDRAKRKRAIQELAEILCCNTLEIEKKITNLKCQYSREVHKIQNSRDAATGPDDVYVSKWFAFKAMQFLQFGTRRYSKRKKKVEEESPKLQEEYIVSDIDPESITFIDCNEETNGSGTGSFNASLSEDAEESSSSSLKALKLYNGSMQDQNSPIGDLDESGQMNLEVAPIERKRTKEEFAKFAESIAVQLADIPDSYSRSVAKLRINQILFEAEIGVYAQTRR